MKITPDDLGKKLNKIGYASNDNINYATSISISLDKPLLIEGAPGVGKSSLAKAVATALKLPFIRVQLYDGLTDDKILFDYNYQKQLLTLESVKPFIQEKYEGQDLNNIIKEVSSELDFYGRDFLLERPILKAINGKGRKVLLLDEIDKAPEEIEYMLYEFLEDYSITIPEYGEIKCPANQKPIVFLTSNNYRELSGALKRRCNYLYIDSKTEQEIIDILKLQAGSDESIARGIARCLMSINSSNIRQKTSISEAIDWAILLNENKDNLQDAVKNSLTIISKDYRDYEAIKRIVDKEGKTIWENQTTES